MNSSPESSSFLSRLKFRVVQPVDIPRCYQLECLTAPHEVVASKSTLQYRQHLAAPFFRCVLLKKEGVKDETQVMKLDSHALELLDEVGFTDTNTRQEVADEACHHVHHSPHNQLIGYVCATRCHDVVVPSTDLKSSADAEEASEKSQSFPYPMKHEANGKNLAIRSIVVQKEYQRLGVLEALLEYYVKSIEIYNAELDEAGINRRRNKIKAKNQDTKIERILLVANSSMSSLLLSLGFRWRATVKSGVDPLYEWEREVESSPPSHPTSVSSPNFQPHLLMDQDSFLVDVFSNPMKHGGGNPAAVVVLQESPTKLIADYYNNIDIDQPHILSNGSGIREMMNFIVVAAKGVQEDDEITEMRAEAWMHYVAKEFNQPVCFVWSIDTDKSKSILRKQGRLDSSSNSDDELNFSLHEEGSEPETQLHHAIRFFTRAGTEVDMCANLALAAAGLIFGHDAAPHTGEGTALSFHCRKANVLQASLVSTPLLEKSYQSPPSPAPQSLSAEKPPQGLATQAIIPVMESCSVIVAMDYPWRTVEPVPPGPGGQEAVLSMLRRAFFQAWSVVELDENDTSFSLSAHHITFMGVTSENEDLLIELSVDGFDMICGRSVDYDALEKGWNGYARGVIICCEIPETLDLQVPDTRAESSEGNRIEASENVSIDFCSRYFQPKIANDDPASGWSHCALGPYFGARRGKERLFGLQSSDRGLVEYILKESEQKVCIVGTAVIAGKTLVRA